MTDFASLKGEVNNWNLESDEKLLSKLDAFLNNILSQCDTIQKNTEIVEYETNSVSIYLHDTFNSLSNLSNKKFIESCMAPVDKTLPPKKQPEVKQENPGENKIRYQQAVKNAIQTLNIAAEEDDLSKTASNTMTAANIFRGTEGLPFIIGSRAFNEDEFVGIVEKTEEVIDFLRGGKGIKKDDILPSTEASNNIITEPNQVVQQTNPSNNNTQPIVNNNNLPPPNLSKEAENALKNNTVFVNESNLKPPPNLLLPNLNTQQAKPSLPNNSENRTNSSNQTQVNINPDLRPLPQQILPPSLTPIQTQKVNEIKANPMYQPTTKKLENLFDDEDEEIGNKDLFKSNNKNKDKFQNLLAPTIQANPFNPFNPNPFDPFGLQNPFLPSRPSQQPKEKKEGKDDPLITLANDASLLEPSESISKKTAGESATKESKKDKLNKLFEDSEDEEERLNKQKKLSELYKKESEIRPPASTNKIAKLFNDDEEGTSPKKEEKPKLQTKRTLFDDDEDTVIPSKTQASNRPSVIKPTKGLFDDDDEEKQSLVKPKTSETETKQLITKIKPAKKSLFDDDDDEDKPVRASFQKKNLFEESKTIENKPSPTKVDQNVNQTLNQREELKNEQVPAKIEQPVEEPQKPEIEKELVQKKVAQPVIAKPNSFAQMITRAKLNKRKQSDSEEDEDSEPEEPKPKAKPIQAPQKIDEKTQIEAVKEENLPITKSENLPVTKSEDLLVVKSEELPTTKSEDLPITKTEPEEENHNTGETSNRPSNIKVSARISELQKNLNLKADTLFTSNRESLTPWRQSQAKTQNREEDSEKKEDQPLETGLEVAMQKPSIVGRGKKTMLFEDDEDDEETTKPTPKPSIKNEKPQKEQEEESKKSIEEIPMTTAKIINDNIENITTDAQPQIRESISHQDNNPISRESTQRDITSVVAHETQETYPQENPLNLLRGLKEMDQDKSRKSEKSAPVKVSTQPTGGDNPLDLLSGLRELDNQRKSAKSKKRDLFEDSHEKKSITKKSLFDDDDAEDRPSLKPLREEQKTLEEKQRESKKLKKLFDDSDEEQGGGLFGGKPSISRNTNDTSKPSITRKAKSKLFDDDDD